MRWLDGITDSKDMSLSKLWQIVEGEESDMTSQINDKNNINFHSPFRAQVQSTFPINSSFLIPNVSTYLVTEHLRIDAFELWCWRRLLRVPWTPRRSNKSILKEISPGFSLEGMMLKLKLQYFGHLM